MPTETSSPATTGPVAIRTYVQTSHLQFDMTAPDGTLLAHRYQHVVTGIHYVRDYAADGPFAAPVYQGRDEIEVRKAWVRLYRRYN